VGFCALRLPFVALEGWEGLSKVGDVGSRAGKAFALKHQRALFGFMVSEWLVNGFGAIRLGGESQAAEFVPRCGMGDYVRRRSCSPMSGHSGTPPDNYFAERGTKPGGPQA
jgi:hypothetical protein